MVLDLLATTSRTQIRGVATSRLTHRVDPGAWSDAIAKRRGRALGLADMILSYPSELEACALEPVSMEDAWLSTKLPGTKVQKFQ